MKASRRRFLALAGGAVAAPALLREGYAQAPQVTLKMHHFLPPVSNGHAKFLAPWAQKVEADSQRRIKIDIFPSMQLGGTPPQLFDQVRDGVADLVWTLPGSTPGRFPGIEVVELPFIAARRGVVNAKATQELYETQLKDEFREVHPICLWSHDHGLVHANKQVKTMEDLKGLKLRSPTRQAAEALRALGASPIAMPVPQVPESLAQRVIDGGRHPVGGRARAQGAGARQVPHRDPGLADALHGELHARDEQGEIREPAGRPEGRDRQELGPGRRGSRRPHVGRAGGDRVRHGEEARQHHHHARRGRGEALAAGDAAGDRRLDRLGEGQGASTAASSSRRSAASSPNTTRRCDDARLHRRRARRPAAPPLPEHSRDRAGRVGPSRSSAGLCPSRPRSSSRRA